MPVLPLFVVRVYHEINRSLRRQRKTKIKPGWIFLAVALGLLNGYLLFIKDLPGTEDHPTRRAETVPPGEAPRTAAVAGRRAAMGEIRGIAGIRDPKSGQVDPGPHLSCLRFDFQEARGLAGQRTLEQWCRHSTGTIENGDTFTAALSRSGLGRPEALALIAALRGVMNFRQCRPGEQFNLLRSPGGEVQRFVYHKSPLVSYRVDRRVNKLIGYRKVEKAEVVVEPIALRIEHSVYSSMESAGESPELVMDIVDIFSWDIDFYIDIHRGDFIRLLVEKAKVNGRLVRYGRILAVEYKGEVGVHRAFWYQTADERVGYYDENGDSLRKAFLKSPLKFTRISSGYGMRVHPILGFSKKHLGVDLAAPRRTPVWAPGDGTVVFAGRKGISGKLVVIRHPRGYETIFAHLHGIADGVRKGARVKQKQVIGGVGSTGRSTGPHLHYGMKKNGKHVNPFAQKFPPANPVPKDELPAYKATISRLLERLERISEPPDLQTASVAGRREDAG